MRRVASCREGIWTRMEMGLKGMETYSGFPFFTSSEKTIVSGSVTPTLGSAVDAYARVAEVQTVQVPGVSCIASINTSRVRPIKEEGTYSIYSIPGTRKEFDPSASVLAGRGNDSTFEPLGFSLFISYPS